MWRAVGVLTAAGSLRCAAIMLRKAGMADCAYAFAEACVQAGLYNEAASQDAGQKSISQSRTIHRHIQIHLHYLDEQLYECNLNCAKLVSSPYHTSNCSIAECDAYLPLPVKLSYSGMPGRHKVICIYRNHDPHGDNFRGCYLLLVFFYWFCIFIISITMLILLSGLAILHFASAPQEL